MCFMKGYRYLFVSALALLLIGCTKQSDCLQLTFNGEEVSLNGFAPTSRIDSTHLIIPETIEREGKSYAVTKIDENAFKNYDYIVTITLPNSIKEIGEGANYIKIKYFI